MRYYLTPITMAIIKETNNRRNKTGKQLLVKRYMEKSMGIQISPGTVEIIPMMQRGMRLLPVF